MQDEILVEALTANDQKGPERKEVARKICFDRKVVSLKKFL